MGSQGMILHKAMGFITINCTPNLNLSRLCIPIWIIFYLCGHSLQFVRLTCFSKLRPPFELKFQIGFIVYIYIYIKQSNRSKNEKYNLPLKYPFTNLCETLEKREKGFGDQILL